VLEETYVTHADVSYTGYSRQHLPREQTDVVLRDPGGKARVVLYIPNTRNRLSRTATASRKAITASSSSPM
jgi:hypothetical protein